MALHHPSPISIALAQHLLLGVLVGVAGLTVLGHFRTRTSRWLGAAILASALFALPCAPFPPLTGWGGPVRDPGHHAMAPALEKAGQAFVA